MTKEVLVDRDAVSIPRRRLLLSGPVAALAAAAARRSHAGQDPGAAANESDWQAIKQQFLVEPGLSYFNVGTYGPALEAALELTCRDREQLSRNFNSYFYGHFIDDPFQELVDSVAGYVGVRRDALAFMSGATEAMNFIANGLQLREGDEVLTTTHEHQAGIYPYLLVAKRRGIRVRQLPMPSPITSSDQILELFASAIGPRTRVLSFCHVQYTDGLVLPVKELCALARSKGLISVVDGAQAVGMLDFKIDDLGCDLYAASLHKWLNCNYGTGFLTVREELRERLWPTVVEGYDGWDSVERYGGPATGPALDFGDRWPKAMLKYSTNLHYYGPVFWSIPMTLAFHEQIGRGRIEGRTRALAERLRTGLLELPEVELITPEDPALSAGITSFRPREIGTAELSGALRKDGIVIRKVTHEPIGFDVNRVCTHYFNTEQEVDGLLAALRRHLRAS